MAGRATLPEQYCDRCDLYVVAEKDTHGVRNAAGLLFAPFTVGASVAATKSEGYHCPHCGSMKVQRADPEPDTPWWRQKTVGDVLRARKLRKQKR